ncbi:triose-phosphate isomerase [Actinomadura darangshiensis]|uniref:Triosephosphate isomerase n=1 Tax=Actinomadura darangshiensis TaxID=705336 RepID=A0A4R5C2K5_9ACTN|nr:triose-phosphate isomerase [Actinomadura darangshiensis]TDD92556.1 triose-phosphate isomerase [Actinomadura darangshiensis]
MAPATPSGKQSGRKPLMAGNWKMNNTHFEAISLVQKMAFALKDADYAAVDVAVLPPFTAIRSVESLIKADKYGIQFGAQDVSQHASGAYTGEISAAMLAKLGCTYAVVGHSERRQYHAEDDALVNAKAKAALAADITPILCIGEGLEVRKAAGHVQHCITQLDGGLEKITAEQVRRTVIAYEPVWAIGTGEVATPQDAQEVCAAIRTRLAELYDGGVADEVRILYGGSVKGGNIAGIMAQDDVDGALVGGASLDPGEFVKICRYRDLLV